jgi:hypothetical protein
MTFADPMRTRPERKSKVSRPGALAEQDIDSILDDACIERLAKLAKLPANADLDAFSKEIREAARIYARDVRVPNGNEIHADIERLYREADGRQYDRVAELLDCLSAEARELLCRRRARILTADELRAEAAELPKAADQVRGQMNALLTADDREPIVFLDALSPQTREFLTGRVPANFDLPHADSLRDARKRDAACEVIAALCRFGGGYVEGRLRPSGKRSRTWQPLLYAPEPQRNFQRRAAERYFVTMLSLAWLEATGRPPARSADSRKPGPFARLVTKCLSIVGAGHANAVELINELNRRRQEMEKQGRGSL